MSLLSKINDYFAGVAERKFQKDLSSVSGGAKAERKYGGSPLSDAKYSENHFSGSLALDTNLSLSGILDDFRDRLRSVPENKRSDELKNVAPEICGLVGAAFRMIGEYDASTDSTNSRTLTDSQYLAGMSMSDGYIAELACGEGKTIAIALPAIIHSLEGRLNGTSSVHVVTSNEYLAKRDVLLLSKVYESFGLDVKCMPSRDDFASTPEGNEEFRRAVSDALSADITYGTISQFGFQDLEEQFSNDRSMRIPKDLRRKRTVIIDEVDDVLLDKALVGLNLSGVPASDADAKMFSDKILGVYNFVKSLDGVYLGDAVRESTFQQAEKVKGDYTVAHSPAGWPVLSFTDMGMKKLEEHFESHDLFQSGAEDFFMARQALIALLNGEHGKRYVEYVVDGDNIVLVDSTTGRSEESRRLGNLLHCFLEAKEGVSIKLDSDVWNQTSVPLFLEDSYGKVLGTTGTSSDDLRSEYGLETIVIPSALPSKLVIQNCRMFDTVDEKYRAIADTVVQIHETGDPVLVDALDVKGSGSLYEYICDRLVDRCIVDVVPRLLNASTRGYENEIIKDAGKTGAITIASQMAGRGTDIKVDPSQKLHVIVAEHLGPRRLDRQAIGRTARQGRDGIVYMFSSKQDSIPSGEVQRKIELNNSSSRRWFSKLSRVLEHSRSAFVDAYDKILDGSPEDVHRDFLNISLDSIVSRVGDCSKSFDYVLGVVRDAGVSLPDAGVLASMVGNSVADVYSRCLIGDSFSGTVRSLRGVLCSSYSCDSLLVPDFSRLGSLNGLSSHGVAEVYVDSLIDSISFEVGRQRPELLRGSSGRNSWMSDVESIVRAYGSGIPSLVISEISVRELSSIMGRGNADLFVGDILDTGSENVLERLCESVHTGCTTVWNSASRVEGKCFSEQSKNFLSQSVAHAWRSYLRDAHELIQTSGLKSYGGSEEFVAKELLDESVALGKRHLINSINAGLFNMYTTANTLLDAQSKKNEHKKSKGRNKKRGKR